MRAVCNRPGMAQGHPVRFAPSGLRLLRSIVISNTVRCRRIGRARLTMGISESDDGDCPRNALRFFQATLAQVKTAVINANLPDYLRMISGAIIDPAFS